MTKILLAIDRSPCSQASIEAVINRFTTQETEVRVLHVVDLASGVASSHSFAEGPTAASDVGDIRQSLHHQAEELIALAVQRLESAGFHASADVRDGDPRDAILECATDWQPDVIVVGSHGRRGLGRFLLGSVSESVMRHAKCSVQVVRA